jgi:hypothetical protein
MPVQPPVLGAFSGSGIVPADHPPMIRRPSADHPPTIRRPSADEVDIPI